MVKTRSGTGRKMIGRSEDSLLQEISGQQLKVGGDKRQEGRLSGSAAALGIFMQVATETEDQQAV